MNSLEEYLKYDLEDFVKDESFINWAKTSKVEDINLWNSWISDHPEKRSLVDSAKSMVLNLHFEETIISPELEDSMWKNIAAKTSENPKSNKNILRRLIPLAIAAGVALLLYVNLVNNSDFDTNISTSIAMNTQELLPDESIVDLNANSTIKYDKATWDGRRELHLEGEAFFSVKKGSKFTVHTSQGSVEVLGTSFNIYTREGEFKVECETGKVKVSVEGSPETTLTPQQSVIFINGERRKLMVDSDVKRSNWRRGFYNYDNESVRNAFDDLERQYDVKIISDDQINKIMFRGSYSAKTLDASLEQILWPNHLEVSNKGKVYSVSLSSKD